MRNFPLKFNIFLIINLISGVSYGQNLNIQQNQQNVNINVPVIEKEVYIERYHPVYIEKPRQARKLPEPEILLGYLCVFPEDIGNYQSHPTEIINNINQRSLYGRNTWRIPTHDELMLMVANADRLGLSDEIYMATTHANGNLRLVSTEATKGSDDGYKIGSLIWNEKNFGARDICELGIGVKVNEYEINDLISIQPLGWRIPTEIEFKHLLMSSVGVYLYGENDRIHLALYNRDDPNNFFIFPLKVWWTHYSYSDRAEVIGKGSYVVKTNCFRPGKGSYSTINISYILELNGSKEEIATAMREGVFLTFNYDQLSIYESEYEDEGYVRCVKNL